LSSALACAAARPDDASKQTITAAGDAQRRKTLKFKAGIISRDSRKQIRTRQSQSVP
jgi:hypothetical protein